jgi:hypothetical protein
MLPPSGTRTNGRPSPGKTLNETALMPIAAATAADLALKIVRARTGSGPSTKLSWRSGKIAFQARIATRAEINIVVAMRNSVSPTWALRNCVGESVVE